MPTREKKENRNLSPVKKPVLVMPHHDPEGTLTRKLFQLIDTMKEVFSRVCLILTTETNSSHDKMADDLIAAGCDVWFYPTSLIGGLGNHYRYALELGIERAQPEDSFLFSFPDRVIAILGGELAPAHL